MQCVINAFFFTIKNSEFMQEFHQANITDKKAFLNIVRNIIKMVELQSTVNDVVEHMKENTSVKINVTKFLLDEAIDHACSWVSIDYHMHVHSNANKHCICDWYNINIIPVFI